MDNSTSTGERATLQGAFVQDARDALLVIVAVHAGLVPPVPRRLSYASQRTLIRPGAVFVWRTGDIARWTDNCQWTASHSVQPKLLMYHQRLDVPRSHRLRNRTGAARVASDPSIVRSYAGLYGSWGTDPTLMPNGMLKKTFSCVIGAHEYRLAAYHSPARVVAGLDQRPSEDPALQHLLTHPVFAQYETDVKRRRTHKPSRSPSATSLSSVASSLDAAMPFAHEDFSPVYSFPHAMSTPALTHGFRLETPNPAPRVRTRPLPAPIVVTAPVDASYAVPYTPALSATSSTWSPLTSGFGAMNSVSDPELAFWPDTPDFALPPPGHHFGHPPIAFSLPFVDINQFPLVDIEHMPPALRAYPMLSYDV